MLRVTARFFFLVLILSAGMSDQRFKVCVQYCSLKCLIMVSDAFFAIFPDEVELPVGYFHKGELIQAEVPPQKIAGTGVSRKPYVPSFL